MRFFNVETKAENWNSERYIEVIDVELFEIDKAIKFCTKKAYTVKIAADIWFFIDCANAITRLQKFQFRTHLMEKLPRNCKELYKIDYKIDIHWISERVKISGNLQEDEPAKERLKKIENQNNFMWFQSLNKRIESDTVEKWNSM